VIRFVKLPRTLRTKTALGSPDGWDTLVAFVRGKSGNIEKYTGPRSSRSRTDTAEITAREAQRAATGAHGRAVTAGPGSHDCELSLLDLSGHYGLAATERQIADVLGRNYKDYAHLQGGWAEQWDSKMVKAMRERLCSP